MVTAAIAGSGSALQVVLRQDVESLGLRGEVVNVARGYARNYLLPRGLAETATPGLVRRARAAKRPARPPRGPDGRRGAGDRARLEATELRFDVNAGPTGSLFGSVTATNVADKLWEDMKIRIDRRKLAVGTIKRIGRYTVPVEVFGDVTAELRLLIVPEGGELPPEEALEAAAAAEAEETEAANQAEAEVPLEEEPVTAEPAGEETAAAEARGRANRPTRPKRAVE